MGKIAFIADCHLGYRHRFKSKRLNDFANAYSDALTKALKEKPDAIVFLGDLFHHSRPDPVSMRLTIKSLLKAAEQTKIILTVGNHEIEGHLGTAYTPVYGDLSKNIFVLSTEKMFYDLNVDGVRIRLIGFEYGRNRDVCKRRLVDAQNLADGDINILCIHQAIEGYLAPYELSINQMKKAGEKFDLIVSGHVHKHQLIEELKQECPAYYVGSTERVSFNESGNPTGFMVFDMADLGNPKFIHTISQNMKSIRLKFKGTPNELNQFIEKTIFSNPEPILKIDVESDLDGDPLDVIRDWSLKFPKRIILDVNILPKGGEQTIEYSKVKFDETLIEEYFEKNNISDDRLRTLCIELFQNFS